VVLEASTRRPSISISPLVRTDVMSSGVTVFGTRLLAGIDDLVGLRVGYRWGTAFDPPIRQQQRDERMLGPEDHSDER
jgi:hypothetical protein